jgi:CelD/BcsL family acetyltransferase involved in cellulose biosynthesis
MRVNVIPAKRLTDAQIEQWDLLRQSNPDLQSPFFCPEFTLDVAAVRDDVEVAVLEADGEPVGFFPYQRSRRNAGIPVGGILCDFQGVIALPGVTWDAAALIRDCGLSSWRFHHLLAAQQAFAPYHWLTADSASIDLRGGFDAYCQARRESGSNVISGILRKLKKAAREIGPLRFVPHSDDPRVFQALVAWKSQQYRRIRSVNYLTAPCTMALVKRLLARQDAKFSGLLSAVYFADQLVAVHLGLRARGVLHVWFPTYDERLARYSPGMIFYLALAKAARDMGIHRIDLGRGSERFKMSLRSEGTLVAEGAVGLGLVARTARRTWLYARQWGLSSPVRRPARWIVRTVRGLFLPRITNDQYTIES